jgi:hypothetical protein
VRSGSAPPSAHRCWSTTGSGALVAGWTQPHEISSETVERITEITELVATAIANAESRSAHFGA